MAWKHPSMIIIIPAKTTQPVQALASGVPST